MASPLEDFRRQYPEYNDWSDDDLAESLRQKHYPDMDPLEYRRQLGLRALNPKPPKPTLADRIDRRESEAQRTDDPFAADPTSTPRYRDPDGFEIDVDRPELYNDDGSISTESTIGVNFGGREHNIPSIIDGQRVSNEEAVIDARARMAAGWVYPNYATVEEAEAAARRRSASVAGARDQAARDRDLEPFIGMIEDQDGPLQSWFRDKAENAEKGLFNNSLRLAGERGSKLLGNAVQGIGRAGEYYNDYYGAGQIVFGSDWGPEDPADGKFRVRYMNAQEFDEFERTNDVRNILTDSVPEFFISADFGGMERHTAEAIKHQYHQGNILGTIGSVLTFGLEQGITSIPDMIAVMGGPASISMYVNARSNEMGTTRAINKGMAGDDAGFLENLEAMPFALGSALMERIGAKGIVAAFGNKSAEKVGQEVLEAGIKAAAKRVAAAAGTAAAKEAATEAFQEGVLEYLAETLGTAAPMSWDDAIERGFFGALGGATFGGAAGGTLAIGGQLIRAGDEKIIDEMEEELADQDKDPEGGPDPEGEPETGPPPDTDFDEAGNVVEVEPDAAPGATIETGDSDVDVTQQPTPTPEPVVPKGEYFDARLKRDEYRIRLADLGNELVAGGGITLVPDRDVPGYSGPGVATTFTGRTPSQNPGWFQSMNQLPETRMSVKQVHNAINKAVTGQELGVRQQRVIQHMLNEVQGRREDRVNIDYAKEQLREARLARARARAQAASTLDEALEILDEHEQDNAGELFEEEEYHPEMSGEARIVDELADMLDDYGEAVSERVAIILDSAANTAEAMQALEELLHAQQAAAPGEPGAEPTQVAGPPAETEGSPGITGRGPAAAERDQLGDLFEGWLDSAIKRFAMEAQGQATLDDMQENEISPHVVSEIFWTETYFQLTGPMQAKFKRMLEGLGFRPGDVGSVSADGTQNVLEDWFNVAQFIKEDLADDAGDLEGTERGYVALMQWANLSRPDEIVRYAMSEEGEPGPLLLRLLEKEGNTLEDMRRIAKAHNLETTEFELEQEQDGVIPPKPPAPPAAPSHVDEDLGVLGDLFSEEANKQRDLVDEAGKEPQAAKAPEVDYERRSDADLRAKYEALTVDQFIDMLLTDELTGMGNRRAFNDMLPHADAVVSIDVDGLGSINDNISHDLGDALLQAVANALEKTGAEVYHISGDEFYLLGESQQELAGQIDKAKIDLAHQVLEDEHGRVTGVYFTHGIAGTKAAADNAMELSKKKRERNGTRQPKGVMPNGAVQFSSRPEVLAVTSGSNNVSMIGKHGQLPIDPDGNYVLGNGNIVTIPKEPVRRRHVMKYLERKFGLKIYQGRVKGRTKLGFYRPGHGEIRVKFHNDLEVTAHEISHWLDDRHPWISQLYKQYREEILQVSYDDKLDFEGYAEFMRTWFTQDHEAQASAPGFYDAWMAALETHPGIKDVALDLQQMMHGWYLQGGRARLQSRFGGNISFTDRVREIFTKWQDKWLQRMFDGLRPFKEIERQVRGQLGSAALSGYKSLRLARGAHGVMQGIFNRGTVNWDERGDLVFTGKGLKAIFDLTADRHENQLAYMVARRAQELRSQNRENLIRPDEIQAGLKLGLEDPDLVTVFDEWQAFNDRMMDFYQSSGILSKSSRAAIQEMNQNYVPFNRVMDTVMGERVKRGGGTPFMRLHGGTQDIADIMESIIGNTSHLVHMSLVNRGKRAFYQMIDGTDNQTAGMYAARVGKETRPTHVRSDQVVKAMVEALDLDMKWYNQLDATGMYQTEAELEVFNTVKTMAEGLEPMVMFWQFGQDPQGDIDYYFEGGDKRFYEIVDARLWEAIQMIGPQQHNLAVNILGGFANVLRRGVTLTPTFQAKNFIRDTMNAFTLSKGEIIPAASATKALLERIYNDEHYWEYMINGGGFASMADADGINRDRVLDTHKKVWDHLDSALSAFEYANRIAEFKTLKAKGWSAREAAFAGREISTDFAMRGSSEAINVLTISVPFLNARLQGLYRNARELASLEEGRVQFAGKQAFSYAMRSLISITIPTLALYMINKDDERYEEIPDWIKDLAWVIFTGEGEDDYVMIPKPFETGMLWGTLPERMLGYYYDQDEAELGDAMLWMILETFNLNPIPQAFKPWLELSQNQNFTGAPIVPNYLQTVEPSEQYRAYTSDAMIALGRKLNISPLKAEHIVRGHFGTMGTWALGLADMLVGDIANGGQAPTKGIKDNILLSPFVNDGPLRRTHSENHLYDMLNETQTVADTVRLMSRRSPERLEEYVSAPSKEVLFGLNDSLRQWSTDMREIKSAIDMIQADPDLTGDEKRSSIHELERAKNEIARQVYQNINPEFVQELLEQTENQLIRSKVAGP